MKIKEIENLAAIYPSIPMLAKKLKISEQELCDIVEKDENIKAAVKAGFEFNKRPAKKSKQPTELKKAREFREALLAWCDPMIKK